MGRADRTFETSLVTRLEFKTVSCYTLAGRRISEMNNMNSTEFRPLHQLLLLKTAQRKVKKKTLKSSLFSVVFEDDYK